MALDRILKTRGRAELVKCAMAGEFPTYEQFFKRISPGKKMGQFPYRDHFNQIAMEERSHGYPDITFMVRGQDGYPHQIDFRASTPPDAQQIKKLEDGTDQIIRLYCPPRT